MGNYEHNRISAETLTVLNCIDLWSPDIQQSVSLLKKVAKAVARVIALALDLDADFIDKQEMLGEPVATLMLLRYEGQISDPSKGINGAGAHSDFDSSPSWQQMKFQICKYKNAKPQIWEHVAPMKGALIVNLGDLLERWSNCIFKSTLHRVVGNSSERYSIAYFVEPCHDCAVEVLPTCKSEKNPPKFPPIKCGIYLSQRYKDIHADLNIYKK